jgi:hypothetical protein
MHLNKDVYSLLIPLSYALRSLDLVLLGLHFLHLINKSNAKFKAPLYRQIGISEQVINCNKWKLAQNDEGFSI